MGRVYADIQAAVDARRPVCDASGRCCRFEEYGHRLYVSTLELAAFLSHRPEVARHQPAVTVPPRPGTPLPLLPNHPPPTAPSGGGCPFQVDNLCRVHAIRPFGCRMFFCDPASTDWQNEAYEQYHAELKRLHQSLGVPYFYVEWRHALRELELAEDA